jgi:O-antigen/teichoic acid export membrane protein
MPLTLLTASSTYAVTNVLTRSVVFLLLPILTRYLGPEDFGRVAMYTIALGLVSPLVGFSTEGAIGRQYFEREQLDFPNYVTNCLYILLVTSAIAAIVLIVFSPTISTVLALPPGWVWTLVVVAIARYLFNVVLNLWQLRGRVLAYAGLVLGQTIFAAALSIILVVWLGYGWEGRVFGDIGSLAAGSIAAIVLLVGAGYLKHGVSGTHLAHALKFGGGLIPHLYGGTLMAITDRIFITNMFGVGETGLYVVGGQIAMIISVLEHSFNQAWSPWLFERLQRNEAGELARIRRITWTYNVVIISIAIALALGAPSVLHLVVGPDYSGASQFVLWLALGNAFVGMYKMVANQIFFANQTQLLSVVTFTSGLVNVVLNYVLIRLNGPVGAAQATAASWFLSYLLTARLSRWAFDRHLRTRRVDDARERRSRVTTSPSDTLGLLNRVENNRPT